MIHSFHIENFKSIVDLELSLGQVTLLIGENGCGKSNILEAFAMVAAALGNKLDNEFLVNRGVRIAEPNLMCSAFETRPIDIKFSINGLDCKLRHDHTPYGRWTSIISSALTKEDLESYIDGKGLDLERIKFLFEKAKQDTGWSETNIQDFVIYSPEISALRTFERENQIQPLGIFGEGLFKLLQVMHETSPERIALIKEKLKLINWFEDFQIPEKLHQSEAKIHIKDRFLEDGLQGFDQLAANEGFLFLLFYVTLFCSKETPNFFAVDNIESSLNPKLCQHLMKDLVALAKQNNKQVIITTHNPAILDGINLEDDAQRILVVSRKKNGETRVKRLQKPRVPKGSSPVKLSEAFMAGMIGGLPKGF